MKAIVIYYSLEGHTQKMAEQISSEDSRVRDKTYRR